MLDYGDLLAGRALVRLSVQPRAFVTERLLEHDRLLGQRGRFLANLVARQEVASEVAQRVFLIVERNKQALAEAVTLECLRRTKSLDEEVLRRASAEAEARRGVGIAQVLLLRGLISEHEHRGLRRWTLDCIERQQARLLSQFRRSLERHTSASAGPPLAVEPEIPALWGAEQITDEDSLKASGVKRAMAASFVTASSQSDSGDRPRFAIPDWIQPAEDMEGRVFSGYRVRGKVGEGGMGVVYFAEHADLDVPVALKLLPPDKLHDADAKGRFHREILAMSFFDHPHVVNILDAGENEDGALFIAMEFVDGQELMDILERVDMVGPELCLPIFRQVLLGLQAAHDAGILHRDLKPENVLVTYADSTAKLMDFGIARILDRSAFESKIFLSVSGTITGTPEYLSPEQAADLPLDPRSDLYSFGVMMYLVLSGDFPIDAGESDDFIRAHMMVKPTPLRQLCPFLPEALEAIVMKLLEKDPKDRYQSASDLIAAIDGILPLYA
jgi:hypothetical protein